MKKIISLILIIILICSSTSALAQVYYAKADEGAVGMYDFENFTMLVPADAEFFEYDSIGKGTSHWAIGYSSESTDLATAIKMSHAICSRS